MQVKKTSYYIKTSVLALSALVSVIDLTAKNGTRQVMHTMGRAEIARRGKNSNTVVKKNWLSVNVNGKV